MISLSNFQGEKLKGHKYYFFLRKFNKLSIEYQLPPTLNKTSRADEIPIYE